MLNSDERKVSLDMLELTRWIALVSSVCVTTIESLVGSA